MRVPELPPPHADPQLASLLLGVAKPGRYLGGEVNQIRKDPATCRLRWSLIYPDVYEIGMPHQGLRILYHCLNQLDEVWAERCFTPWHDMEAVLRECGRPQSTLESHTPLSEVDVVAFTLQTELSYTNILTCLDLGGIALHRKDRDYDAPLVVAGGAGVLNPEPLADFVDLFFLGDGEEACVEFSHALIEERARHTCRRDLIRALIERCNFLYAPAFFDAHFDGPALAQMDNFDKVPTPSRAVVYDLENAPYPTAPIVPSIRTIHDRISLEIMRGCVQSCRFCQAGYEKRPQRFRSAKKILELARESYLNTGINEIGLTSLSSSDHPQLIQIMRMLRAWTRANRINVSLPSLRVNDQLGELPSLLAESQASGFTMAPEVATDRLRRVINKNILDQDLFRGAREAWQSGYKTLKLYFMVGIPGEVLEDVDGIISMSETCARLRRETGLGGPGQVNTAISNFVPKPLTPFQWTAQAQPEELLTKHTRLRELRKVKSVRLKFDHYHDSLLSGFLARADRRAGAVIKRAWELGARFDGWRESRNIKVWQQAWTECAYGPAESAWRERPHSEVMPWDHLDLGSTREFLSDEARKAESGDFTEHCQTDACSHCGVGVENCIDIKAVSGMFEKFKKRPKNRAIKTPQTNH